MQEVAELSKRYQAVIDACTLINSTHDLTSLLETITKKAMEIMNAEASSLLLVDAHEKELSFKVALGEVADKLKDIRIKVGTGIAGWVAKSGEPLLIPDVSRDSRFFNGVDKTTGFRTKTLLCVPLKAAERVLGVIEVINKMDNTNFSHSDVDFLMAMANQAAIAIENALLYQELRQEKNRIETILNSMSDGVIVTNENAEITMLNPSAKKIFDIEKNMVEGIQSAPEKLQFILNEVKTLREDALFDIVLMKPENVILSNNVTILKTPEGEPEGAVMVLRNVTEHRDKEISRSEFLTLLSFKIYAPLEHLQREIALLSHELDSEMPLRGLYELEKSVLTIKNFVQKLHYFSELEAGPLRLERSDCRISDLVDQAVILSSEEIEDLKIDSVIPELEAMIRVDGGRIIETVMLLIFFISSIATLEQPLKLELAEQGDQFVIRFGSPVSKDLTDKLQTLSSSQTLIEDFCRLHSGGQGLELLEFAFVRHLLDAHGGSIILEDKPEGAYISVTLPSEKGE